jgi:hypothetical protein
MNTFYWHKGLHGDAWRNASIEACELGWVTWRGGPTHRDKQPICLEQSRDRKRYVYASVLSQTTARSYHGSRTVVSRFENFAAVILSCTQSGATADNYTSRVCIFRPQLVKKRNLAGNSFHQMQRSLHLLMSHWHGLFWMRVYSTRSSLPLNNMQCICLHNMCDVVLINKQNVLSAETSRLLRRAANTNGSSPARCASAIEYGEESQMRPQTFWRSITDLSLADTRTFIHKLNVAERACR